MSESLLSEVRMVHITSDKRGLTVLPLPGSLPELRARICAAFEQVMPVMLRVWQETDYRWDIPG